MANGDTKTESYLRAAAEGTRADLPTDNCCNTKTQNLILGVANRIMDVEDEVEELKNNPDVADIVDTYADLQTYDTQHLTDNDIIRVLQDETHDGQSTYYRWNSQTESWTYIGSVADTQMEAVTLTITGATQGGVTVSASKYSDEIRTLAANNKDVVFKINIPSGSGFPAVGTYLIPLFNYTDSTIVAMSVVDLGGTLYSIFFAYENGTHTNTGILTVTEVQTGGAGPTVVQTTGTSTTDVMSQNATTGLIYNDPETRSKISIGSGHTINGNYPISIGNGNYAYGNNEISIGREAKAGGNTNDYGNIGIGYDATANGGNRRIAIGYSARAQSGNNSVALGSYAVAGRAGEVNIGTGTSGAGYNSTNYRVLGGVHDPVDANDAATKGYVDSHAGGSSLVAEITDANFNWNSSTWSAQEPYDTVALWKLVTEPGFIPGWYVANTSTSTLVYADNDGLTIQNGLLMYLGTNGEQMWIDPSAPQNFITYRAVDYITGDVLEDSEATIPVDIISILDSSLNDMWDYVPFVDQGAPDQNFRGTLGQLYTDTDTMHTYQCTAIDDSDPDEENWLYTWTQRW